MEIFKRCRAVIWRRDKLIEATTQLGEDKIIRVPARPRRHGSGEGKARFRRSETKRSLDLHWFPLFIYFGLRSRFENETPKFVFVDQKKKVRL